MKGYFLFPLVVCAALSACCCSKNVEPGDKTETPVALTKEGWETVSWNFDTADGWGYAHQDDAPTEQWEIVDGVLRLYTRAGTRDRSKMYTKRDGFSEGLYTWRIFIPNIAPGEQVSVAGFIYQDDAHELDFEVGYGTQAARESCGAAPGEMVACMTNQSFPYVSNYTPVSTGWHTFSISLLDNEGKFTARWIIDDEIKQVQELMFGPETSFKIMCSVENLLFIGDHIPEYDTSAGFDWVSFTGPGATDEEPEETPQTNPTDKVTRWDFDTIDGWYYYTHNPNQGKQYYSIDEGILSITTKGNTMDRNKLQTNARNFGPGSYTWRLYVPEIEPHAQVSVGAFIYKDDKHELDFEIGYGKAQARQSCGAGDGDLVACLTNQASPFNSTYVPIKPGWHTCTLRLDVVNERYSVTWEIDGTAVKTLAVNFGPSTRFFVACSVENLTFMGDNQPTRDHTAKFDWVSVTEPQE